jgi:hypothetical protein
MAVYPNLKVESIVQVKDKTRLNAIDSYVSKDSEAISLVEIQPEIGAEFIEVTGTSSSDWYLDWSYATEGTKVVTVRVTTDGEPVTTTGSITVVTAAIDNLLSTDADLAVFENDILKWIPAGRNSWLEKHRAARDEILGWLDENGYVDVNGNKYTAAALVDVSEFKRWATFITLRLIFQSISNAEDDVFSKKASKYGDSDHELAARKRAVIRIDTDGDGVVDTYEQVNICGRCSRR